MTPVLPPPAEQAEIALIDWVAETCGAEEVQVDFLGVRPAALANATQLRWEGDPCRSRPTVRLTVTTPTDQFRLTVQPKLTVWVIGPVALTNTLRGEPVQFGEGRLPAFTAGKPVHDGEWTASVDLAQGDPITNLVVHKPVAAHSGDQVTILLRRGTLTLSAPGQLLQDGRIGDTIQVANQVTKTAIRGILTEPGLVEIQ